MAGHFSVAKDLRKHAHLWLADPALSIIAFAVGRYGVAGKFSILLEIMVALQPSRHMLTSVFWIGAWAAKERFVGGDVSKLRRGLLTCVKISTVCRHSAPACMQECGVFDVSKVPEHVWLTLVFASSVAVETFTVAISKRRKLIVLCGTGAGSN